ncbi:MAG: 30S ribosomal protein S13, partial [Candidatus Omnitrophota bacterium]
IGPVAAQQTLIQAGIDPEKRARDLSEEEVSRITSHIQTHYRVEGELRREISQNIRRLIEIGCYRGSRHKKGLPARGQRTRCNARTRKGPRPRVGGIKKK